MIPILALLLGLIAVTGLCVHRHNMLRMLMCCEVLFLSLQLYVVYIASVMQSADMFIAALLLMVLGAIESALGLAVVIMLYKNTGEISSDRYTALGGAE